MSQSPFEVLGVSLDVSDVELKRAYFRKVREHPPETDPEGYHRIHEAYEALKDSTARRHAAELARAASLDPRVLQLLDEANFQSQKGERHAAAKALREAVALAPDFSLARERLINVLIAMEAKTEAIANLEALIARRPESVDLQLVVAQTNLSIYEYPAAKAALERARVMAPEDRRPRFLEARMHEQMERWDDALRTLDETLALPERGALPDLELLAERVHIQIERGTPDAVSEDLQRLRRAVGPEPAAKQEAHALLTSMAAHALQKNQRLLARQLLGEVAVVTGRSTVPLGPSVTCRLDGLPAESRAALEAVRTTRNPGPWFPMTPAPHNLGAALTVIGVGGAVTCSALLLWWLVLVFAATGVAGFVVSRRENARRAAAPLDFVMVRPFHLLRVEGDEVLIVPLLTISRITPQEDTVRIELHDEPPFEVRPGSSPGAVFQAASEQSRRILQLMTTDLLESELAREPLRWDRAS